MTASIQYITEVSDSVSRTEYTFSGVSFGSAGADRIVALCIETRKTGGDLCEVVECTIGGVSASVVFQQASAPSGTVNYAGIVAAHVPTGTSGTIYIKFSLPVLRVGAQVVSVTGSLVDADASLDDHPSVEFDIPAGGAALGCLSVASSQAFDWVGLTEDYRGLVGGSLRVASASQAYVSASNGQTLGVTRTSGTWPAPVGVFAVWGPDEEPEPIAVTLTANTGELSLSGQAATIRSAVSLASDTGSLSIAGQPALMQVISSLVAGGGMFASAGQAAAFITPATDNLAGDTGALAIDGQPAFLITRATVAASTGESSLAGQTAGLLRRSVIAAEQTAFDLAGSDAVFVVPSSDSLAADPAAFAIAGQAASFPASPEVGTRHLFLRYGTDSILALRY